MKAKRNRQSVPGRQKERKLKLLLVGREDELKDHAVRRIFSGDRCWITIKSASLLGALKRLGSETIDLVLIGREFRNEESALFAADARRDGFAGLILRNAATGPTVLDASGKSLPPHFSNGEVLDDPLRAVRATDGIQRQSERRKDAISFSARQQAVLTRVSEGWTNQQIARQLKCTEGAVKATLQEIFGKLGVRKRAQIVRFAYENSLLHAPDRREPTHLGRRDLVESAAWPSDFQKDKAIHVGDFVIDVAMHRAWVRGVETHLSPRQFELLTVFVLRPGELVRNTSLREMFWRSPTFKQDALRVLIRGLRTIIEMSPSPRYIVTERNFGYRFIASPSLHGASKHLSANLALVSRQSKGLADSLVEVSGYQKPPAHG